MADRNIPHKTALAAQLDALQALNVRAGAYGMNETAGSSVTPQTPMPIHFRKTDGSTN